MNRNSIWITNTQKVIKVNILKDIYSNKFFFSLETKQTYNKIINLSIFKWMLCYFKQPKN